VKSDGSQWQNQNDALYAAVQELSYSYCTQK